MTIDGYMKYSRRSHNRKKEFIRHASKRLSMEKLGVVSTDRLVESACIDEFFVVHDEKRGVHKGNKTMATDVHSKGSKGDCEISSKNKLDRELAKIKMQLEVLRELIQGSMEHQIYDWVLQKKRVKWSQITYQAKI